MKQLKDGIRSKVRLDIHGHVHKHFRGTDADKRAANEAAILKSLEERGCPYVPKLLDYFPDENYIVTTNCGQPAPGVSRKKSDALFAELEREYGIRHDDPEPRNVTYSQPLGRFCLIDFELAELLPDPTHQAGKEAGVWRVTWASRSRRGNGHKANDDAVLALGVHPEISQTLAPDGEELLDPIHLVLAVSDGMGGGNAGEFASRLIMSWVKRHAKDLYETFNQSTENPAPLEDLLVSAHQGINQLASEANNLEGMGATVTLAWLTPGMLHLAHIGDSRLYLCRDGTTTQLSEDHVRVWRQFKKRGELKEVQYRTHPRRSALYDVLGGGHRGIHPQLLSHPIQSGDRLLLCSDGIIDGLWDRNIAEELSAEGDPRAIADHILARAAQNDGRDDCTLIVADICGL